MHPKIGEEPKSARDAWPHEAGQPFISVVIPVYNQEAYIESTLQSVLRQSYPHFEVIVVDDGSTDSSLKRIKQLNDHRIRLIRQTNQGVSAARNNGFLAAKGEYIAFLDADDLWFPDKLAWDVETIRRNREPVCMVYSGHYCIDGNSRLINIPRYPVIQPGNFQSAIDCNLLPSTTLIHRTLVGALNGFPDDKIYPQEDRVFFMRLCKRAPAYPTGHRSVLYRQTGSGRALRHLWDFDAMRQAERSTIQGLRGYLTPMEFRAFRRHHMRSLLSRFLRFNIFENARRQARFVPTALLLQNVKGILIWLSLKSRLNVLYACQVLLCFFLRCGLGPWWALKCRRAGLLT
jgi:glycosyltransferase involved in cell wall biosynthesis